MQISLASRNTPDSIAEVNSDGHFIMTIPGGRKGKYRWAQFDDYLHRLRRNFEWQPPCRLSLMARCNNTQHAGTWGFGFWNDPFNTNLGVSGSVRRLPALPNCAWFFMHQSTIIFRFMTICQLKDFWPPLFHHTEFLHYFYHWEFLFSPYCSGKDLPGWHAMD